jgi:hypothetical protein
MLISFGAGMVWLDGGCSGPMVKGKRLWSSFLVSGKLRLAFHIGFEVRFEVVWGIEDVPASMASLMGWL